MDKHQECWLLLTIARCPTQDVLYSMRGRPNYLRNHQHQYQSIEYYLTGMHLQDLQDGQTTHLFQTNLRDLDLSNHHHQCPNNQIYHCLIDQNYMGRSLPDTRLNYRQIHHYQNPATEIARRGRRQHHCWVPILVRGQNNRLSQNQYNLFCHMLRSLEYCHMSPRCRYSRLHQYPCHWNLWTITECSQLHHYTKNPYL